MDDLEIELFEGRAAIMEFDAGFPRELAELKARMSVTAGRYHSAQAEELGQGSSHTIGT